MIENLPLLLWPTRKALTILIFHRVHAKHDPLRPGDPDIVRFEMLMKFIARHLTAMPLSDAVTRLSEGRLPSRGCCITFDDGYADNLTLAQPILEKHGIPATVFVSTGYLDGGRMFNDSVIDAIGLSRVSEIDLTDIGIGRLALNGDHDRRWAIDIILNKIKYLEPSVRSTQVERIVKALGCGNLPNDVMLTTAQLRELSRRGIEIGGHTVNHTILTTLDDHASFEEMATGRKQLENLLQLEVSSFAYPNGRPNADYSLRHVPLVKAAGFKRAVTTASGVCRGDSPPFELPRFCPWAGSGFKVAAQLVRNAYATSQLAR